MYSQPSALSPTASLRSDRKLALRIQSRTAYAMLALSCLLVLIPSVSKAQGSNTIGTVAGQMPPNPLATLATIPNPTGIAEDASGNYYIASQYSYYVYEVNPSTNALTIFAGTGIYGFSNIPAQGAPATSTALSGPLAVAVDNNSGKVYIADNNRILVVANGTIFAFAGTGLACQQLQQSCGDGPASGAMFSNPQALWVDGSGNLFIADTGDNKIRFVNNQSTAVTVTGRTVQPGSVATLAGNGIQCNDPNFPCGDGGSAIAPNHNGARLNQPEGVVTDRAGNIFIGDTRDERIRCVVNVPGGCPNTKYSRPAVGDIVGYAGSGYFCQNPQGACNDGQTPLQAQFHNPAGIWMDGTGNLYVADQWDNKIREVLVASTGATTKPCPKAVTCVTTIAGNGFAGFSGDGGNPKGAEFDGPLAVILDPSGNLTIADSGNDRIRRIANSKINTIAGGGSIGDGGVATGASLANPSNVAWDLAGANYYIADSAYNRIRQVTTNGDSTVISTVAGTGQPTGFDPLDNGDFGPATSATLSSPNGIAHDAAGNLYIADTGNALVRVVNMQSSTINVLGVTIPQGAIATVAGSGSKCENTEACGDGGPAIGPSASLTYPTSVTLDGHGNLYIADYYDNRVREVLAAPGNCGAYTNLVAGDICTLAGTGSRGYTNDGIPGYESELWYPFGVAADSAGNVYIADSLNNRIRCVIGVTGGCGGSSLSVGYIMTYAFNGVATFSGNGGPANAASRPIPLEVALDPAGNLFVGGGAALVVQRIDAGTQNIIMVAGKPGNIGFGGDGGPSTAATLDNLGLAVNAAGNLLIDDQGNNRIREVDMVPVANLWNRKLSFPDTKVGHTSDPLSVKFQNSGLASLPISGTPLSGKDPQDFQITSNSCVIQLPPQSFCYVGVTFTPTQTGQRTATLTINTSLGPQVVNLMGTGN